MTVRRQNQMVKDVTQVSSASKLGDYEILDARAAARFRGEAPEPREGLRAGHIPGSKSVPYADLLHRNGTMKSPGDLRAIFAAAGVDMSKPVITSCGSGITAAIINLALDRIGKTDHALYDGSWAEWGAYPTLRWQPEITRDGPEKAGSLSYPAGRAAGRRHFRLCAPDRPDRHQAADAV